MNLSDLWKSRKLTRTQKRLTADSHSRNALTRLQAANHPDLTHADFVRLSRHTDTEVRGAVASNRSAPPEVLTALVADNYWGVRLNVADNPATPLAALLSLLADKHTVVANAARDQLPVEALQRYAVEQLGLPPETAAITPRSTLISLIENTKQD